MSTLSLQARLESIHQRWLWITLGIALGILLGVYLLKMHGSESSRSALLRWRGQLAELDDGINVWDKYAYPNPPIMAILLQPFVQLPPFAGGTLWFGLKALLALAALFGVLTLLDDRQHPFPVWGKLLAIGMCLRPIEGDLLHGNVNLLILALIVGTLVAFVCGRDALAGALLGLSIACKLTPALFLFYFLWKRAWMVLGATSLSLVLFVLLVPGAVFGWHKNLEYLQSWHDQMIAPYAAGVVSSEHKNQSLPGLLHRMLADEASFSEYDGDRKVVLRTHNLVAIDSVLIQAVLLGCMGLFTLGVMRCCRASIEERPPLRTLAEFGVIALGMLLFCERTWKHHCVTLLLPLGVLAYVLTSHAYTQGLRWYAALTLVLVALLMLSTSTGVFDQHTDAADRFGKLAQVYGAYTWAFLLLLASMFVILQKTRADRPLEQSRDGT